MEERIKHLEEVISKLKKELGIQERFNLEQMTQNRFLETAFRQLCLKLDLTDEGFSERCVNLKNFARHQILIEGEDIYPELASQLASARSVDQIPTEDVCPVIFP